MQGEAKEGGGAGGAGALGELKAKVDGLANLMQQLEQARAGARRTRVGVVVVILLVLLGYGLYIGSAVNRFIKDELPQLQADVMARLPKLQEGAVQQIVGMLERVAPVYQKAAQKDLNEAWPEMREAFVKEGTALVENIQVKAEETVKSRLATLAEDQKALILDEFKDLDEATQNIVMENLEIAFRDATLNVLSARVKEAEAQIRETHAKILAFLPEGERDPFAMRMSKVWDRFMLDELGGAKMLEE